MSSTSTHRLVGVLPTRRLLTAALDQRIGDLMITRIVAIPQTGRLQACEFFVLHKFFAFPVVDEERRILGLIDIGVFTEEVFDIAEREQHEDVFETIGFHVAEVRGASAAQSVSLSLSLAARDHRQRNGLRVVGEQVRGHP